MNHLLEEVEMKIRLHLVVREWLARNAALQYGHPDDPRRPEWTEQANRYRQRLHELLATHWELDPELEQIKKEEWPKAQEIAKGLIGSRF